MHGVPFYYIESISIFDIKNEPVRKE